MLIDCRAARQWSEAVYGDRSDSPHRACGHAEPRTGDSEARHWRQFALLAGARCAPRFCGTETRLLAGSRITVYVGLRPTPRLGRLRGPDTPRRSLAGAPCAPPFCATETRLLAGSRLTVQAPASTVGRGPGCHAGARTDPCRDPALPLPFSTHDKCRPRPAIVLCLRFRGEAAVCRRCRMARARDRAPHSAAAVGA